MQLSEKQTQQRIDEIDAQLRGLRQERDKIRSTVESISIYEDSMNRIETEQEENAERYTQRLMNERGWTREQVIQYDKDCTVNLPPLDPNEPLKRALGLI